MEPESSLPQSQVPATCPYPEPVWSSPHPTSHFLKILLNIILPSTTGSPKWSLSFRFPHQNPVYASSLLHTRYMFRPSHSSRFYCPNNTGWGIQIIKLLTTYDYDIAPIISGNCVLYPTSWTRKQKRRKTLWFEETGTTFNVKNITDSNDPMVLFSTARGLDLSATFLCFNPKCFVGVETAVQQRMGRSPYAMIIRH